MFRFRESGIKNLNLQNLKTHKMSKLIAPSVLAADFANLQRDVE